MKRVRILIPLLVVAALLLFLMQSRGGGAPEAPTLSAESLEALLPAVVAYGEEHQAKILAQGIPLTESQLEDARWVGVDFPEQVRILVVPAIPLPDDPELSVLLRRAGLDGANAVGMTLAYGIYLKSSAVDVRSVLAHELTHVAQYEDEGGLRGYLERYLEELMIHGYRQAPLEKEAYQKGVQILEQL